MSLLNFHHEIQNSGILLFYSRLKYIFSCLLNEDIAIKHKIKINLYPNSWERLKKVEADNRPFFDKTSTDEVNNDDLYNDEKNKSRRFFLPHWCQRFFCAKPQRLLEEDCEALISTSKITSHQH